ncbi:hypothetical protein HanXRQr2_Chr02g0046831 [Helianthus annuus]|uniref:Uncharacterized protein n=1 Tax=Helianthus annuus TaxID=4232 RepID=A0A9K3JKR3_HELAN|nr:hypothetical protein HanXRQr2_Chr02g0046831 [Helianthus annuus]
MYDLRHKKPRVMATTDHQLQYNKNVVTTSDDNELSTRITECLSVESCVVCCVCSSE